MIRVSDTVIRVSDTVILVELRDMMKILALRARILRTTLEAWEQDIPVHPQRVLDDVPF